MRKLFVIPLFFLAACATSMDPQLARVERVTQFCDGFAEALNTLSIMRDVGSLTEKQISRVDQAVAVMEPVCLSSPEELSRPILDQAFDMVIVINTVLEANK